MQRRKPMSAKHQERRRRALARLDARIEHTKSEPTDAQLIERATLQAALGVSSA